MGETFGGDLYYLWRVANVHLPRIARTFYEANQALVAAVDAGPRSGATWVFERDDSDHGNVFPFIQWNQLRLSLVYTTAINTSYLNQAREAINRATEEFKLQDEASARELDGIMNNDDDLDGVPNEVDDLDLPDPDDPGHPENRGMDPPPDPTVPVGSQYEFDTGEAD